MANQKDATDTTSPSSSSVVSSSDTFSIIASADSQDADHFLQHFKDEIRISQPDNADLLHGVSSSSNDSSLQPQRPLQQSTLRRDSDSNCAAQTAGLFIGNPNRTTESFIFTSFGTVSDAFIPSVGTHSSQTGTVQSPVEVTSSGTGIKQSSTSSSLGSGTPGTATSRSGGAGAKNIRRTKGEPSLSVNFPSKIGNYELKITRQPEDQHRARYLTEGSRGTVKDKTQSSHPTVSVTGCEQTLTLQVFVGTETGRIKPHGFYQACKVSAKNSTPCIERDIEGTTVIEIQLEPKNTGEMVAVVDCMGILKLRNADVEQRIGLAKSKKKKVPTATLR